MGTEVSEILTRSHAGIKKARTAIPSSRLIIVLTTVCIVGIGTHLLDTMHHDIPRRTSVLFILIALVHIPIGWALSRYRPDLLYRLRTQRVIKYMKPSDKKLYRKHIADLRSLSDPIGL